MSLKKLVAIAALILTLLWGIGFAVWAFTGGRPVSLDDVSASDLTQQWGCGRSFGASNHAQTGGLVVSCDSSVEPLDWVTGSSEMARRAALAARDF